jgi:hypothetical protein
MATRGSTYTCRTDLFHKPVDWRLEDDILIRAEEGKQEERLPLAEVTSLHLMAAPTRPAPNRFFCTVFFGNRKVPIGNTHYVGFADFKDQTADFRPFVKALHQAVAHAAPSAVGRIGASRIGYALMVILGWGSMVALVGFLIFFWDMLRNTAIIKAVIVLTLVGALWRYTVANKPRNYRLTELPEDALPKATE